MAYDTLGYGFLEVVYKDAIEIEFLQRSLNYRREDEHSINYKGSILKHKFFADFTLQDSINDEIIAQTLNYLKASGLRLALIINFGKTSLEYKRLVY
jgi:GxxExxY protein